MNKKTDKKMAKHTDKTKLDSFKIDDLSECDYFSREGLNDFKKAVTVAENKNIKMSDMKKNNGEADVVKDILEWLNSLPKCKARKVHGNIFSASEPDIDCVLNGLSVKIEVKNPGEEPTQPQLKKINEWKAAGCLAFWTDNLLFVEETLKKNKYI